MYPGRTEDQKKQLTQKISDATIEAIDCDSKHISVSIEEIDQKDWKELVCKPDILEKKETLYKGPGHST